MPLRLTILSALTLAAAAAAVAPGASGEPGRAEVRLAGCGLSSASDERFAIFTGRMRALAGAERMTMRFSLLARAPQGSYEPVEVRGLDVWQRSKRGARGFVYTQRVTDLRPGVAYRALVRFRWHDASGHVIRTEARRSAGCRQLGPLPNLELVDISARPAPAEGTSIYSVTIANTGRLAGRGVRVIMRVDGALLDTADLEPVPPGDERSVTFTGPVCRRGARASVESSGNVPESSLSDNELFARCPLPG